MTASDRTILPLEGKTTVDTSMQLDPQILSYKSAQRVAQDITDAIRDKIPSGTTTIVIADSKFLSDSASVKAAYFCLDDLTKEYETLAKAGRALTERRRQQVLEIGDIAPSPPTHESLIAGGIGLAGLAIPSIMSPALSAVNTTLELLGFFREDVEYHGIPTAIDGLSYEIALASSLSKECGSKIEILIPALQMFPTIETGHKSLQKRLVALETNKAKVWSELYPLINELAQLEADLDFAVSQKKDDEIDRLRSGIMGNRSVLQPFCDALSLIDQRYTNLMKEWEGTDGTLTPKIARMLSAEAINSRSAIYLHSEVVVSGGYYRTKRNLFRTLFTGDGVTFVGGVVVRWALINLEGKLFEGGVLEKKCDLKA